MFTGLISEIGDVIDVVAHADARTIRVRAPRSAPELNLGDSISVAGVCLTATELFDGGFATHAMSETLGRSTLGSLGSGDRVNLELAARLADRLGGHLVQGHVDGVAEVDSVIDEGTSRRVWLRMGDDLMRLVVEKGSITVDGVSLTVDALKDDRCEVALIPHTLEVTTLGSLVPGTLTNIEIDVIAKYVERLMPGLRERT